MLSDFRNRPKSRFFWLAAALFAAVAIVQFLTLPGTYLGREHDDAHYVLASHGILRGEYRLGISPGNPPLTFITPGWPLLLTPASLLFGERWDLYSYYAWFWLVVCDLMVMAWLMRKFEPKRAMLGFALFGLNPLILARAGHVMSEIPALALTLALFLAMERGLAWWGSGLWVSFLWLVRQPSIVLAPAIALWHRQKKQCSAAAQAFAASLLGMGGWMIWLSTVDSHLTEFDEMAATSRGLGDMLGVAGANAAYYIALWGATLLPLTWADSAAAGILGIALFAAAGWGALLLAKKKPADPAMAWLAGGVVMHLLWPWHYERYLVSFLPMLVAGLLAAFESIRPVNMARACRWGLGVLAAAAFVTQGAPLIAGSRLRGRLELGATYEWIRTNIPQSEAVAGVYYSREALYTGRPFAPLPAAENAGEFAAALQSRRVQWVLIPGGGDFGSTLGARFAGRLELDRIERYLADGSFFSKVYSDPGQSSTIYRLR